MRVKPFNKHLATAAALGIAGALSPALVNAEVSASAAVASNYMWRGQELFSGGTISGSLDYAHDSGLYTGLWISSESPTQEYDFYAGFAGEAGEMSYDIGYVDYNYPELDADNFEEVYVSLGYMGLGFDGFFGVGETGTGDDNKDNYYAFSYTFEQLTATVGMTAADADDSDYTHFDLTYAYNDNLSFLASKVVSADDNSAVSAGAPDTEADDLKFSVMYSIDID